MFLLFKRLIISAIIPVFGGVPTLDSAMVVITVREKTFLIQSVADDGNVVQSGSTKKRIRLIFNENGRLAEEPSEAGPRPQMRIWGRFDPEAFQLITLNDGTAEVKVGPLWQSKIATAQIQNIELVQTEAAIEVWIP